MKGSKDKTMEWLLADRPDDLFSWYAFLATYQYELSEEELDTILDCLLSIYIPFVLTYTMEGLDRFCIAVNRRVAAMAEEEEEDE